MNRSTLFTLALTTLSLLICNSVLAQNAIPLTPPGVQTRRTTTHVYANPQSNPSAKTPAPAARRPSPYAAGQRTSNAPIQRTTAEMELPQAPSVPEVPAPKEPAELNLTPPSLPDAPAAEALTPPPALEEPSIPAMPELEPNMELSAPAPAVPEPTIPEPSSSLTPPSAPSMNTGEPREFNNVDSLPIIEGPTAPAAQQSSPAAFSTGTGEPGAKVLNGSQAPQIVIEKIPPKELLVGQSAVWKTIVKNVGQTIAVNVEVKDLLPKGSQLIETNPPAIKGFNGELVWKIGDIPPGKQITVSMEIMPLEEGRMGSVAQVSFQTAASGEGVVAKPQLAIQTQGVKQIGIGNTTELTIVLSNPGTGTAKNVVLTENVPPQLQHEAKDSVLTYNVGDLKPNETRTVTLTMTAIRAGKFVNSLTATADPGLNAESRFDMEVIAPQLRMTVQGPTRRFLEREGSYKLAISNPGTAPATHVAMRVQLPNGLEFVRANNSGVYDRQTRTVRWLLEELPANDSGDVELVVVPTQIGQQTLVYQATADKGIADNGQKECLVEGMAALLTQLSDTSDPVLIGEKTTYSINVVNQGTKAAQNVRVSAQIPAGMEFLNAEAPTSYRMGPNNTVVFDPAPQLPPKAEIRFKILVKAVNPGDQRLKLSVVSDELSSPVTKEESTQVYQDQM
ncbi:MAG: DUF11 domain-containing protein [Thermoguttaceae bacterium]|nr:DUF11 domain-containing protein [Thermoguttaceae bacterium]